MVRQILSIPRRSEKSSDLYHLASRENLLFKVYAAAMMAFVLGCFSYTPLMPYAAQYRWHFFGFAAAVLTVLNVRDMMVYVASLSHEYTETGCTQDGRDRSPHFGTDMYSGFLMTVASVMMFNSAVLASSKGESFGPAQWQFFGAFAVSGLAYLANGLSVNEQIIDVIETRNAVVLQMVLASVLNMFGALLAVGPFAPPETAEARQVFCAWMHGVAGVCTFSGIFVNHFHTRAFLSNEEVLYGEYRYEFNEARRRILEEQTPTEQQPGMMARFFGTLRERLLQRRQVTSGKGEAPAHVSSNDTLVSEMAYEGHQREIDHMSEIGGPDSRDEESESDASSETRSEDDSEDEVSKAGRWRGSRPTSHWQEEEDCGRRRSWEKRQLIESPGNRSKSRHNNVGRNDRFTPLAAGLDCGRNRDSLAHPTPNSSTRGHAPAHGQRHRAPSSTLRSHERLFERYGDTSVPDYFGSWESDYEPPRPQRRMHSDESSTRSRSSSLQSRETGRNRINGLYRGSETTGRMRRPSTSSHSTTAGHAARLSPAREHEIGSSYGSRLQHAGATARRSSPLHGYANRA